MPAVPDNPAEGERRVGSRFSGSIDLVSEGVGPKGQEVRTLC